METHLSLHWIQSVDGMTRITHDIVFLYGLRHLFAGHLSIDGHMCVRCLFVSSIYNVRRRLVHGAVNGYRIGLWTHQAPALIFAYSLIYPHHTLYLVIHVKWTSVSHWVVFFSATSKANTTHHTNFKNVHNRSSII